jgi:predicted amidophosphoribosyltransferase
MSKKPNGIAPMASSSFIIHHSSFPERCPTCRAAWRGVTECPRCGTDLAEIMQVAATAWQLREHARKALAAGDQPAEALALAQASCQLHATPRGLQLLALALLENGAVAEAVTLIEQLLDKE